MCIWNSSEVIKDSNPQSTAYTVFYPQHFISLKQHLFLLPITGNWTEYRLMSVAESFLNITTFFLIQIFLMTLNNFSSPFLWSTLTTVLAPLSYHSLAIVDSKDGRHFYWWMCLETSSLLTLAFKFLLVILISSERAHTNFSNPIPPISANTPLISSSFVMLPL